jgi:hypothetical protein
MPKKPRPPGGLLSALVTAVAAGIIALGILPSLTALSAGLRESVPAVARYFGPLNPLKLGAPVLLLHVWLFRQSLPRTLLWVLGGAIAVGTGSTLIAAGACGFPPEILREWSVIVLGLVAALSLALQPRVLQVGILLVWAAVIYGSTLLEVSLPASIDWLYAEVFDPNTRALDIAETGRRVLTGVFGRQSLAKLLAWTPWLLLAYSAAPGHATRRWLKPVLWGLAVVSTGAILATSQRGPFVGALAGWIAFVLYHGVRLRNRKLAWLAAGALLVSLAATAVLVPRPLLETRVRSLLGVSRPDDSFAKQADAHRSFRVAMTLFSLKTIATHPLGNACISDQEFLEAGISHFNHSHNIVLQQFRERGWAWGLCHLALWLAAILGAWKLRSEAGAALVAGLVTVLALGMFDHPWFVLNHSMMMWALMIPGVSAALTSEARRPRSRG